MAKANDDPSLRQNTRYHTDALGNETREGPRRGGDFKDTEILSLNARFELTISDDKGNVDRVGGREIQFIDRGAVITTAGTNSHVADLR